MTRTARQIRARTPRQIRGMITRAALPCATLLLAALATLALAGCDPQDTGPADPRAPGPGDPAPQMDDVEPAVFEGYTEFGFDVFEQVRSEAPAENIVLSPTSLAFALAMTYNGAEGETRREMADALRVGGIELDAFNTSNAAWLEALRGGDTDVELAIANSIWIRDAFPVQQDFQDRNREYFDAAVEQLDFDDPAAPDVINAWVAEHTRGRIDQIVEEISSLDMLFLINAVYFLGEWTQPFAEDGTSPGQFTLPDGSTTRVPMMTLEDTLEYAQADGHQALRLPYGDDERFAMYVFLPDPGSDLESFYEGLDAAEWARRMAAPEPTYVELYLPRFTVEYEKQLKGTLRALGIESAFAPTVSDFSGINPEHQDLHVSQVLQKTFLQVNEEGTEAAAVTSVTVGITSAPAHPVVRVDRPFFLAIHDGETDTILFMGQITAPEDPEWEG